MPRFPSVQWFEALRREVNQDPGFRALGSCDTVMGVQVGDRLFSITFEAFECTRVSEISQDQLRETDFYLEMPPEGWREFLENIQANGVADADHTLNTLDLSRPGGILRSRDELLKLSFFRYYLSLQHYFNSSSKVKTVFAKG